MGKKCDNCGYERRLEDTAPYYECPGCGVLYSKMEENKKWEVAKQKGLEDEQEDKKEIKHQKIYTLKNILSKLLYPFIMVVVKFPRLVTLLLLAYLFWFGLKKH